MGVLGALRYFSLIIRSSEPILMVKADFELRPNMSNISVSKSYNFRKNYSKQKLLEFRVSFRDLYCNK